MADKNKAKRENINEQIRAREIRLIGNDGEQVGIIPTIEALKMARDQGLDLIEIAPNGNPPVCKIADFGKYKYEEEKKLRNSNKNQKVQKEKEIRMQPKIGSGDLDTKAKHVQEFLDEGDKVKVTIRFRGRELAHTELGFEVLKEVEKRLSEGTYAIVKPAAMEGRFMSMTLSPKATKPKSKPAPQKEKAEETEAAKTEATEAEA